jgi:hypothetical protein
MGVSDGGTGGRGSGSLRGLKQHVLLSATATVRNGISLGSAARPSAVSPKSLPNGLDLRPKLFRRWCLARVISLSDNPIASNGQAAPQLSCPVVGRFHFWLPRALGSQFFQDPAQQACFDWRLNSAAPAARSLSDAVARALLGFDRSRSPR